MDASKPKLPAENILQMSLEDMQSAVGYVTGGLSEEEAGKRLLIYGPNEISSEKPLSPFRRLWLNIKNPMVCPLNAPDPDPGFLDQRISQTAS